MARKQDIEHTEAVAVYGDEENPSPAFRPVLPGKIPRIRTAKDAKKLLGRLISSFARGEVANNDAKDLAYLLSVYVTTCTAADIEERIEALEKGAKR